MSSSGYSLERNGYLMVTWFKTSKPTGHYTGKKHYALNSILATVGYILSPLSWWNDMVVNVPLAYVFSIPFSMFNEQLFLPAFVVGYWLTNVLGLVLLHKGVVGLVSKEPRKKNLWQYVIVAFFYTAIIMLLVWLEWVPMPTELMQQSQ